MPTADLPIPTGQVAWLTRNLPVWTGRIALVKHFASRFRRARLRGERATRRYRRAVYAHALATMEGEQELCRAFRM